MLYGSSICATSAPHLPSSPTAPQLPPSVPHLRAQQVAVVGQHLQQPGARRVSQSGKVKAADVTAAGGRRQQGLAWGPRAAHRLPVKRRDAERVLGGATCGEQKSFRATAAQRWVDMPHNTCRMPNVTVRPVLSVAAPAPSVP